LFEGSFGKRSRRVAADRKSERKEDSREEKVRRGDWAGRYMPGIEAVC